ncbi:MAG: TRAP transporter small permease subunit [Alphaproteobacteria bacterium]|nr:TRAP transporter small permease subunit [Alphaproteobacteria bacterium]
MGSLAVLRRWLERALAAFCVGLMALMFLIVVMAVLARELGRAFSWYDEVATIVLVWLTYYGSALGALKRSHLGSPEVMRAMGARLRLPLFVLGEALVVAFFLLLGWAGLWVVQLLEGDRLVSLPWVPVQLTQSVIPIGAALFVACELLSIPDEWRNLGRAADAPAGH